MTGKLAEMEEEHSGENDVFFELDLINKANVAARLKEIEGDADAKNDLAVLNNWLKLNADETDPSQKAPNYGY